MFAWIVKLANSTTLVAASVFFSAPLKRSWHFSAAAAAHRAGERATALSGGRRLLPLTLSVAATIKLYQLTAASAES